MKKLMSQIYEEVDQMLDGNYLSKIKKYYQEYNELCENGEIENDIDAFDLWNLETRLSNMYNEFLDKTLSNEDL